MDYTLPIVFLTVGLLLGGLSASLLFRTKAAILTERLEQQRKTAESQLALLNNARQELSNAFKALSAEVLESSNRSFLQLAETKLGKFHEQAQWDLEKRQQAISEMVKPVSESLQKVDSRIHEIEKARIGAYESLAQQVRSLLETENQLRSETSNLVKALRAPVVRGRWGEIQLRRVVEMAGMLNHCDFREQQSAETDDGRLRPDLLVRLPANKNIVVDAKTPLSAYLEAIEAQDDETRKAKLKDHARQIRDRITSLSRKAYWDQFQPAPEFVILFLPGETFFSAALEQDPALIEAGVQQRVILATPTTLIALLRTVAYGWRQERLAQNAQEISNLGRDLYKRIVQMVDHWARLGKSLGSAIQAYNEAVGSLESRVLVKARKFKELEATSTDLQIEPLIPVDHMPRSVQIPELSPSAEDNAGDAQEEAAAVGMKSELPSI
ncbi:MAG TPA: DNA recombination protein RmuC [Acidobacteriota bacterium]